MAVDATYINGPLLVCDVLMRGKLGLAFVPFSVLESSLARNDGRDGFLLRDCDPERFLAGWVLEDRSSVTGDGAWAVFGTDALADPAGFWGTLFGRSDPESLLGICETWLPCDILWHACAAGGGGDTGVSPLKRFGGWDSSESMAMG